MSTRVKVYTRHMDPSIYALAMNALNVPFPRVAVEDSTPLGYLLTLVADEDADYVINLDEDAFVTDNDALIRLLDHVIESGYVNCGMPDGGVVTTRHHNPLVTNPFFTIMHTAKLREPTLWGEYIGMALPEDLPKWFPRGLLKHDYWPGSFEPYDEYLTWVALNFPVLYLDAETHADGISTILHDHEGHPFLTHSWYGREYRRSRFHHNRIDAVVKEGSR
jgi:hypothetical protein